MIRETTLEAHRHLRETNALSPMRMRVWEFLCECQENRGSFPTASELAAFMGTVKGAQSNQNVVTRLGELRDMGMVREHPKRDCTITGYAAYAWEALAQDAPLKIEKVGKIKCKHCNGTGFVDEEQIVFDLKTKGRKHDYGL